MRYYLFFLLTLLLAAGPALAQTPSVIARLDMRLVAQVAPGTVAETSLAAPDTAAAIHRLFVAKRHTYRNVALGTIVGVGTAIAIVASVPDTESSGGGGFSPISLASSGNSSDPAIFGIAVCSVPVLLVETLFCAGWSHKKERRVLEAWQRHHLSAFYYRKLKPKYFR